MATVEATSDAALERVHAYIKPGNEASRRAFARAGYVEREPTECKGERALHLTWG